ncbi:hypothetical protein AVEN_33042-1 [Araneus ventricosus]|uniref:Uncharacterized protein n=1 Tax=Araneus ventricosus TaxID=182803 RepID=A0A4Y2HS72_ARAVE|nr:hypothetical protein AVEN_33042-1 [Araneus ventricosus]
MGRTVPTVGLLLPSRRGEQRSIRIRLQNIINKKVYKYKKNYSSFTRWRCWESNPGHFTCKANALPLSYTPLPAGVRRSILSVVTVLEQRGKNGSYLRTSVSLSERRAAEHKDSTSKHNKQKIFKYKKKLSFFQPLEVLGIEPIVFHLQYGSSSNELLVEVAPGTFTNRLQQQYGAPL